VNLLDQVIPVDADGKTRKSLTRMRVAEIDAIRQFLKNVSAQLTERTTLRLSP